MLSATLGMPAMLPVVFGVAGYRWCPDDRKLARLGRRINK
jgi:hypothetical protein